MTFILIRNIWKKSKILNNIKKPLGLGGVLN